MSKDTVALEAAILCGGGVILWLAAMGVVGKVLKWQDRKRRAGYPRRSR